jgi:hypothetical protein
VYLTCHLEFREVAWEDLRPGDEVFYFIPARRPPEDAHGPFTVVDPAAHLLRNAQGVALRLHSVRPILPVCNAAPVLRREATP